MQHDQERTSTKDRSSVCSRHAARPDLWNGNRKTERDIRIPIHTYACIKECPQLYGTSKWEEFYRGSHVELKLRRRFPRGVKHPGPFEE